MAINFEILQRYVPQDSLPILKKWFNQRPFKLTITKNRVTKLGDFRPSNSSLPHRISVNATLNKYAFLITLTHEFAHLLVWLQYQHKVKAHGAEWKLEFATLMNVLLVKNIYPEPLKIVLEKHLKNPPATSTRDIELMTLLKEYDPPNNLVQLSSLEEQEQFILNEKRLFVKGKKRRVNYVCTEMATKKTYLIHGVAEVERVGGE